MSLEQGTMLRNGKTIDPSSEENTLKNLAMTEPISNDSDTNESSDISSQLSEMKEYYERKINELQSEFCQLKDLMMAVINKTKSDSPSTSTQGPSKQPLLGRDMITGVTDTHSIRPTSIFTSNLKRYQDDDTDEEG